MDKEFFDRQMRIGLDYDPLTEDWTKDQKAAFVERMSAHILNNWAMVSNQKPRGDRQ